jgi:hypothetical protein
MMKEHCTMFLEQNRWKVLLLLAISLLPLIEGKDANWDFYNYHLYVAHALVHGRLSQDFMAASLQGYLNPLLYLPTYWMIMADWPSVFIRLALASVHSLNLLVLWKICERILFPHISNRKYHILIAVLLGISAPVFLGTLGTTFGDPAISVFVLFGLLLLCKEAGNTAKFSVAIGLAGLSLGLAAGLKPTNIIYVISAVGAMLVTLSVRSGILKVLVYFGVAAIAGWLITGGWWAWKLYGEFGNPFFPLFNNIFHSPDFPAVLLTVNRFLPGGVLEGLAQVFRMADYHSGIYVEPMLPDLRLALIIIFAVVVFTRNSWQRLSGSGDGNHETDTPSRVLPWFFLIATVLWLATSGNGRYGLPVLLLAGPVLHWMIIRSIPNGRWPLLIATAILIAQNAHAWNTWNGAWDTLPWSRKWVEISVPKQLQEQPYLYFTTDLQTDSFVIPFVHPKAAFVNLLGQYPIPPTGPGSDRVKRLMAQHIGQLRMMVRLTEPASRRMDLKKYLAGLDESFSSWGLRTDESDCVSIPVSIPAGLLGGNPNHIFLSCALQPGTRISDDYVRTKQRLTPVFGRIEDTCPLLFSPPGWRFERKGGMWSRRYMNTDIILYSAKGRMFYSHLEYGPFDVAIGSIGDWETGKGNLRCERPPAFWSAKSRG